jgi:enoyl-CoA hydratase/carnithine racemase
MTDKIVSTQSGGIAQIGLNRPEKKNAITSAMYAAMADALEAAEQDAAVRVITLTGSGDSFSSGNDVADFLQNNGPTEGERPVARFLRAISSATKPLIAGVNGMAVGIGVTMLLHCDLVYASESATFQLAFTNLGLVPEASSSMLLPNMIGYHRAAELMLLGEGFDARTAVEIGFVNALVPPEKLASIVQEKAEHLAAKPLSSILATKALLKRAPESVPARMAAETEEFSRLLQSPEAKAIMQAFMDRRKPS